jgi:hypothetical protein
VTSFITCPEWAVPGKKWEKVSIVTCTNLNMCVTSICHKWPGKRPWMLTPKVGIENCCGQEVQVLTIWWACSLKMWNCFLRASAFWWWKAWDYWACCKKEKLLGSQATGQWVKEITGKSALISIRPLNFFLLILSSSSVLFCPVCWIQ